jgi:hypothetical protein
VLPHRRHRRICGVHLLDAEQLGMRRSVRFPPRPKPAHYKGNYARRAKAIRDTANANPLTRCRCGLLAHQHPPHRNGAQGRWTAGHVVDGQVGGALVPEWSTCNLQAGARLGNLRSRPTGKPSRAW